MRLQVKHMMHPILQGLTSQDLACIAQGLTCLMVLPQQALLQDPMQGHMLTTGVSSMQGMQCSMNRGGIQMDQTSKGV